jgi:3-oxoacyl-[acyl-carrier protein] reductase
MARNSGTDTTAKRGEARHVVISGVSRGLGAAVAADLLEQGYAISGFSRHRADDVCVLEREYGDRFRYDTIDITSADSLHSFISGARAELGEIYGLINNAATVQQGVLATLPEVDIDHMIEVNLSAALRLSRLCVRDMIQSRCGRVVNISSIVGARGYNGLAVYSATKAALDGLTRSLAREVGRRNITVNSVAPGYMKTDLSAGLDNDQLTQIARRTPLGRLAEISDVVPLVRFLLSEEAAFITSQTILVDGGLSN